MTEKIIVKRERTGNYIIFFVDDYPMTLQIYTKNEGHGTACYQYYLECKPVGYTDVDVIKFVTDYVKYIRTLPDMEDYNIKMTKRMNRW